MREWKNPEIYELGSKETKGRTDGAAEDHILLEQDLPLQKYGSS